LKHYFLSKCITLFIHFLVSDKKDFTHLRDKVWPDLKMNALKKRDESQKTGAGSTQYSDLDDAVLSVIGHDSRLARGRDVPEQWDERRRFDQSRSEENFSQR